MKKLILFAGLPGVGKSTISRRIGEETGAVIVDIDDFKKTDVDPALVTQQIDPPELRWSYYLKSLKYVFDLFEKGTETVIMDEVFHLHLLRSQLEDLCAKEQVGVIWVEVRCPYDTVEKRLKSGNRNGHILSTDEALKMYLMFEKTFERFPDCSKNHIIANNIDGANIDCLVAGILERS